MAVIDGINLGVGVFGVFVSLGGFGLALRQLNKARTAAESAEQATEENKAILAKNVMLSDLPTCIGIVDSARQFLTNEEFQAALIRLTDLRRKLIELRSFASTDDSLQATFQRMITQTRLITNDLEKRICDGSSEFNLPLKMKKLADIETLLQETLSTGKYQITRSTANDTA